MSGDGWQYRALAELAAIGSGSRPPDRPGPVLVMGANGPIGSAPESNFGPGFLVGRVGAAGAVNRVMERCWASDNTLTVRARTGVVEGRFLDHLLRFLRPEQLATKNAQPLVTQTNLRRLGAAVPLRLPEQRRIAEILDTLDEAIRRTEQVIAKLQQMKQGLLHDLLTRGIDEHGELRDPERHPEHFKDSPLGRIPRGWEVRRVGSLLSGIEQGWSPDCEAVPATVGAWGVLKTTSVVWSGYADSANKALPSHLSPRPEYEVRPNDVLMTRAGPNSRVGVVALVTRTQGRLMLSDKLYRLVPSGHEIEPAYLVLGLSGGRTQRHLSTLKTGLAESQTNISQAIVRSLWLPVPQRCEQVRICDAHAALSRQAEAEGARLDKLRTLKHGLMGDLLTGRVRVTSALETAP